MGKTVLIFSRVAAAKGDCTSSRDEAFVSARFKIGLHTIFGLDLASTKVLVDTRALWGRNNPVAKGGQPPNALGTNINVCANKLINGRNKNSVHK
jgi:hypothetical protein